VKAVAEKRVEDVVHLRSSEVDRPMIWIDETTGKIVDRSSAPACRSVVDQVRRDLPVMSRRPQEADRVFIDLVGPRPPLTINGCDGPANAAPSATRPAAPYEGRWLVTNMRSAIYCRVSTADQNVEMQLTVYASTPSAAVGR
jgi:hypothetical protein